MMFLEIYLILCIIASRDAASASNVSWKNKRVEEPGSVVSKDVIRADSQGGSNAQTTLYPGHCGTHAGVSGVCWCVKHSQGGVWAKCGDRHFTSVPKDLPYDTRTLWLRDNDITSVNFHDFDYLTELKELILDNNKLTTLPTGVFDKLDQLYGIDLSDNHLTSLPLKVFQHQPLLFYLHLNGNPLTCSCKLYQTLVDVIPKLNKFESQWLGTCGDYLDLRTMIPVNEEIFCGKLATTRRAPTTTPTASTKAHTTKSKGVCEVCFCHKDIDFGGVEVDCSDLYLTRVPKDLPHDTTTISLNHNDISKVLETDFNYLKRLKALYFRRNKLTSLPPHVFDKLNQLEIVTLHQNQFTSLPPNVFKNQVKMTDLSLHHNPLTCSCELYHTLVDVIARLTTDLEYLGTCDDGVDLRTMTHGKEHKFCGKSP